MSQLLATNFANAFECSYPDMQLAQAVCTEYEEHIESAASGEGIILLIFKDQSILLIDTAEGLWYEFTGPNHALEFISKTPKLAKKHLR